MRRGICSTCNDPVTQILDHGGARWIHDHSHQRCVGHIPHGNPAWAFHCGWVCEFPHEVTGVKEVLPA